MRISWNALIRELISLFHNPFKMDEQKKFVGNVGPKTTQFGEMYILGFNKDDIRILQDNLNERGWINVAVKKGRKGSWYMEILPELDKSKKASTQQPEEDEDDIFDL